jgi:D-aminopeptidase
VSGVSPPLEQAQGLPVVDPPRAGRRNRRRLSTANAGAITPGAKSLYGEGRGRLDELSFIPWGFLDPFYEGVVQAVEEAVVDVLVLNEDMVGFRDHRTPGLPNDRLVALLTERGVIRPG